MTQKPRKMHLKISIGSDLYVLGTLSFNLAKNEIYYLFHHSETAPKKVLALDSNNLMDPPIHISWHRKRVHIRTETGVLQYVEYPKGDLFPDAREVRPLLVEGITLNDKPVLLRRDDAFTNFENADECLQLKLPQPSNFSLILMLVPNSWATTNLLLEAYLKGNQGKAVPLWYLRTESHEIGRILAFERWDVLVWTTPFVRKMPSINEAFSSGYRIPDFVKPMDSLFDLVMQAKKSPVLTGQQLDALRSVVNAKVDQQIQNIKIHCLNLC
ncbi:MAG: hypothetical protein Q8K60_04675 [Parachlamydiaceae bacterium]|nr:hypothetical protein [Parachlamydiaceae bacterium]